MSKIFVPSSWKKVGLLIIGELLDGTKKLALKSDHIDVVFNKNETETMSEQETVSP